MPGYARCAAAAALGLAVIVGTASVHAQDGGKVKELVESINEGIRPGYRLVVKGRMVCRQQSFQGHEFEECAEFSRLDVRGTDLYCRDEDPTCVVQTQNGQRTPQQRRTIVIWPAERSDRARMEGALHALFRELAAADKTEAR